MWNLYWTGVRFPSPPLMKTKTILLSFLLLFNASSIIKHSEIVHFLIDKRPKRIMYWNVSSKLIHIDVEVIKPKIKKDHAVIEYLNIFFFPSDFTLMHTKGYRYINFIEI